LGGKIEKKFFQTILEIYYNVDCHVIIHITLTIFINWRDNSCDHVNHLNINYYTTVHVSLIFIKFGLMHQFVVNVVIPKNVFLEKKREEVFMYYHLFFI
jgi:hypothetical protein